MLLVFSNKHSFYSEKWIIINMIKKKNVKNFLDIKNKINFLIVEIRMKKYQ
jgi:hypothetical protein